MSQPRSIRNFFLNVAFDQLGKTRDGKAPISLTQEDYQEIQSIMAEAASPGSLNAALELLADIRAAAGDPDGKMMQTELVQHIAEIREQAASAQGGEPQNCPRCHSDSVGCDSSRELQVSKVNCGDCGFSLQAEVEEDTVIEMWNLVRTESCADYEEYADTRVELAEIDSPQPPAAQVEGG